MFKAKCVLVASLILGFQLSTYASDVTHFKATKPETFEQAQAILIKTNKALEKIVASPEISYETIAKVHELTYTLENALQKMRSDIEKTEAKLERLHLASEKANIEAVKALGEGYLVSVKQFMP